MSHARLSPSNHRWVHCPGSVRVEADYANVSGAAAIDGTGSHLLLELCIKQECMADAFLGQIIGVNDREKPEGWEVKQDRVERVNMCLMYLKRRQKEIKAQWPGSKIEIRPERKVNPGILFGRKDWYGTCDITITVTDDQWRTVLIEIIDYKDGRLFVPAEGNSQLQSYAIGANLHLLDLYEGCPALKNDRWDSNVRMTIVQPKNNTPIRYDDCKLTDLVNMAQHLHVAAKRTDDEDAPLIPDRNEGKDWCRWCLHRDNCTELKQSKLRRLEVMNLPVEGGTGSLFELLAKPLDQITDLSNEKLGELMDAKATIDGLFGEVEQEVQRRIEDGQKVEGYAMEPGRMSRVWSDTPDKIEKALKARKLKKDDIWETKLRSPAQILKNATLTPEQRERISREYITEKMGTLKLKKVRRQEEKKVESMFDDLPGIEELKPQPEVISFF